MTFIEASAFCDFYLSHKDIPLPIRTSYKLAKLYNRLTQDVNFYNEQLQKLVRDYGEYKDGELVTGENGVFIRPECVDEMNDKLKELSECTFDIDTRFSFDEFEGLRLSPSDVNALLPFLAE